MWGKGQAPAEFLDELLLDYGVDEDMQKKCIARVLVEHGSDALGREDRFAGSRRPVTYLGPMELRRVLTAEGQWCGASLNHNLATFGASRVCLSNTRATWLIRSRRGAVEYAEGSGRLGSPVSPPDNMYYNRRFTSACTGS